ncbi:MAG: hypothetical protein P4L73_16305 [Caulobacteraceae bacterium]|nr:hypothetical protein [Caulobacteraceae bacterium]
MAGGCDDTQAGAQVRAGRRVAMLERLAGIGMTLAETLEREVVEAAADDAPARRFGRDPAAAFARIARAVRLTLALEARFDEALQAGEAIAALANGARLAEAEAAGRERRMRGYINRTVAADVAREMIEAEGEERGAEVDVERLLADLDERLAETDTEDFADLSVGALVQSICEDLGVTFDPAIWSDDDEADDSPAAGSCFPHAARPGAGWRPDRTTRTVWRGSGPPRHGPSP